MKRIVMAVLLLAGINSAVFAQEEQSSAPQMSVKQMKTPEQRAQMLTDRMEKKLNLTADQKKSVYDINLASAQKMNDARQNRDHEAMRNIKQERDVAFQKVLSQDQYTQYQQLEAAMMQKRMENRQNRMSSSNGD